MADALLVNISHNPLKECLSQRKQTAILGTRYKVSDIISWRYTGTQQAGTAAHMREQAFNTHIYRNYQKLPGMQHVGFQNISEFGHLELRTTIFFSTL